MTLVEGTWTDEDGAISSSRSWKREGRVLLFSLASMSKSWRVWKTRSMTESRYRTVGDRETRRLQKLLPFEQNVFDAIGRKSAGFEKRLIKLPTSGELINTLSLGDQGAAPIVLLHGWGAGAVLFAESAIDLAEHFRVHLVDWLGCGGSSRPHFDRKASPKEAEAFFLDSFREWVLEMRKLETGFQSFALLGHSLGGYLSACYALKHPEDIDKLLLVSPVGVPERPDTGGWKAKSLSEKALIWLMRNLWDANIPPQAIARPFGTRTVKWLCRGYARRRFPALNEAQADILGDYLGEISSLRGSGEYALNTILEFGAWARAPLEHRLDALSVPVSFAYGDQDWMDWRVAASLSTRLRVPTSVQTIPDSGHFVFIDNHRGFSDWLLGEMEP